MSLTTSKPIATRDELEPNVSDVALAAGRLGVGRPVYIDDEIGALTATADVESSAVVLFRHALERLEAATAGGTTPLTRGELTGAIREMRATLDARDARDREIEAAVAARRVMA